MFVVIDKRSGEEVDLNSEAFIDEVAKASWADNLVYCDLEGFALGQDGTLYLIDECGNVAYVPTEAYEAVEK